MGTKSWEEDIIRRPNFEYRIPDSFCEDKQRAYLFALPHTTTTGQPLLRHSSILELYARLDKDKVIVENPK